VDKLLATERFYRDLAPMEGSQQVIGALMGRYEVFITTAAMEVPRSFRAKYEWLREHFPFVPPSHIVFCGDKSVLAVDFLIDDQPRHFRRLHGQGVLFDAAHNRHETRYPRVANWAEVKRMFLAGPAADDLPR
jgi:5'(3')-deoxyribonucleotidase